MKKVFLAIFLLLIFLPVSAPTLALAQVEITIDKDQQATISPVVVPQYDLPYPGILPGNPLYFLKTLRDRVIYFLISDPFKKAEFDLLQADKRLESGVYLIKKDRKNISLAETTISKGQNYFEEAVGKAVESQQKRKDSIAGFFEKLFIASRKHQQVLKDLEKDVNREDVKKIQTLRMRMERLEKKVSENIHQK